MITRIVKLSFEENNVIQFLDLFKKIKATIAGFKGCLHIELLKETGKENIFFTYSKWEKEEDLENYRNSPFFKETWAKTKMLMKEKAEAWSVEEVNI